MKKRTRSRRRKYRVKRETPKTIASDDVKGLGSTGKLSNTHFAFLQLLHQLETQTLDADSKTSRSAFEVLTDTLREVLTWLHNMAALHPLSLGALLRGFPEHDAWAKYERGDHVGARAAIELARLYRQIQCDLRSRSNDSVNRLRAIRYGFTLGKFLVPPNAWFCEEFARKADYRPRGKMAVWTAGKIEELRRIKENRSQMRGYANIEIAEGRLRLRTESETDDVLANWFRSEMVEGDALKRLLDNLPVFGSPNADDLNAWRKFVRNRLLTSKVIGHFDQLFPNSRRKLDGVIVATLESAWRAVQQGGKVNLP